MIRTCEVKLGIAPKQEAKVALATIHHKVCNRRRDFIRQEVASLVRQYDGFAVEKLQVKELVEKGYGWVF